MSRAIAFRIVVVAALGSVLLLRSTGRGDDAAKPADKAKPAAIVPSSEPPTVERALAKNVDLDFENVFLDKIASELSSQTKINVLVDWKAMNDASIIPQMAFSLKCKDTPLRVALSRLLTPHELAFIEIDNRVLQITTSDIAQSRLVMRDYDIRSFAAPASEFSTKFTPGDPATLGGAFQIPAGGIRQVVIPAPPAIGTLREKRSPWDAIQNLIMAVVSPSTWDANGGTGSMSVFNGLLSVSQTEDNQAKIADLLGGLEQVRNQNPKTVGMMGNVWFKVTPATVRILRSLDAPVDFEFEDVPLKDIAESLAARYEISIELDQKALPDASIVPETIFTMKLHEVSFREALDLLLGQKDLGFVIENDALLITTRDVARTKLETRIYCVGDLIPDGQTEYTQSRYGEFAAMITGNIAPTSWDTNGGAATVVPFPQCKALVISQTQEAHEMVESFLHKLHHFALTSPSTSEPEEPLVQVYSLTGMLSSGTADDRRNNGQQLVNMIRKLVDPASWNNAGTYIGLIDAALVVRQTPTVHRHIQNLLDAVQSASRAGGGVKPPSHPTPQTPVAGFRGG